MVDVIKTDFVVSKTIAASALNVIVYVKGEEFYIQQRYKSSSGEVLTNWLNSKYELLDKEPDVLNFFSIVTI